MFVTGLLEDWMRKLEESRRRNKNCSDSQQDYATFLAGQRTLWTPPDLFDKCCPRFLAAGGDQESLYHPVRRKDGSWSCPGGCNKVHPTITLFFDTQKVCSVAILSFRLDPFVTYFDSRVNDGSATCKTPFYYELQGYIRENLNKLKHQTIFGSHLVKVALGALRESDIVQRLVLEKRHCHQNHATKSFDRLEEVLQICHLHRLGDDLDVLSIHCMQRTNNVFRRVANSIAQQRMKGTQFSVTALVDGYFVSGYSVFRRNHTEGRTVIDREHGAMVEYAVGPSFVFEQHDDTLGKFVFREAKISSSIDHMTKDSVENDGAEFSWACEELSFANLEREWGDIGVHEYVGQKVIVHWRRSTVDIPNTIAQKISSTLSADLPVFHVKLDCAPKKREMKYFSMPLFDLKLYLVQMKARQVDDVTVSFEGHAKVVECNASFDFLVSAYASSLEPLLVADQEQMMKTRPLLQHEEDFLNEVKRCASMRTHS
jgi:hypothetical protein